MKIFIIHNGRQEYLLQCIGQLLKFNSSNDIIFLSDDAEATKKFIGERDITYSNISDYSTSANEFAKYYQHRSYNKEQYELFCMQRWLILNEYANAHNINTLAHIDTDVLIYCNMKEYYSKFLQGYDFCCTGRSGGVFLGSRKGLNEFSSFLMDRYKNKFNTLEPYSTGEKIPSIMRGDGYYYYDESHCITDMTLFYIFLKEYCEKLNLKTKDIGVISNSHVFDSGITAPDGFQFVFGLKKIRRENGIPYCYLNHKSKKGKIFFDGLHFQGESKIFMRNFYNQKLSINTFRQLKYCLIKGFIQLCESVFRLLGIYDFMRNVWIKIVRLFR